MDYKLGLHAEEEIVNDPGWMDWKVRTLCLNGNKDANIRVWTAYGMVKKAYREKTDGPFPEAPNTILAGERAIHCSALTHDPDAIVAAMVYKPASDGSYGCTLSQIRERLGMIARMYAEKMITLEYSSNLDEYNKTLAEGLPEALLATETAVLWCNASHLLDKYVLKASEPGNRFEVRTDSGLVLLQRDEFAAQLGVYHSKAEILHNYVGPELKAKLILLRTGIMGMCSGARDRSIWNRAR